MYAVAMVIDGFVYGVLLVDEDHNVLRAWVDPELEPRTLCEKMEFRSDDPEEVLEQIAKILEIRYIPEVDPDQCHFNFIDFGPKAH